MLSVFIHRFAVLTVIFFAVHLLQAADCAGGGLSSRQLAGKKVAVVAFARTSTAQAYLKTALSRMETILADNDITALDQDKAAELKNVFNRMDDPGAFVTAEDFVENAEKFKMAALVAIYLYVEVVEGLADYFTAAAHADIRFIDEDDAKVTAISILPMGAPGRPPSDGLTRSSAAVNAVQRAIDEACRQLALENFAPATPRLVHLDLKGPSDGSTMQVLFQAHKDNSAHLADVARLENQTWRAERVTCTALAPAGALGAVAGYIIDTDFRRRPQRLYGSRIHLIDIRQKRQIQLFDCFAVEKKVSGEIGDRRILDCTFVSSWRYLAAVSGGKLFFWDTERGQLLASPPFKRALKTARLGLASTSAGRHIVVDSGRCMEAYKIIRTR